MIYCSLSMANKDDAHRSSVLMFKEMNWITPPIPGNHDIRVALGLSDDGEETGWSIVPNSIWFESATGNICVELRDTFVPEIGDTVEKYVKYAKNDGFVSYEEWKAK